MATKTKTLILLLLTMTTSCGENDCLELYYAHSLALWGNYVFSLSINPNDTVTVGDTIWFESVIGKGDIYTNENYCNFEKLFVEGRFKIQHYFSIVRGEQITWEDYLHNFPYCERTATIGNMQLYPPCLQQIDREYFCFQFIPSEGVYRLKVACVFVEPGEFAFSGYYYFETPEAPTFEMDMMSEVWIANYPPSGYIYSRFSQTGSTHFPLTVVERK